MAKRFQFSLNPVLRFREMQEDEKRRDFAVANRAVEEARLRIEAMQEERAAEQASIPELYQQGAEFSRVTEAYRYINAMELQIGRALRELAKLEAVAEEKRRVFVEARRARRALELLRDKRKEEYEHALSREEQATLDELAVQAQRRQEDE